PLAQKVPIVDYQIVVIDNKPRLQVEEESEMSLELLRFTRQKLQEYQQGESKDCQSNIDAASLRLKLFKDVAAAVDAK
nr:hypothetical protein [Tanacetum cinerariifolium]